LAKEDPGTFLRLRAAPMGRGALLAGKTIPFLLVSLIQLLMMFGFGRLLFGMSWGPYPWMLLVVLVSTSMAATGLGLLVATTAQSDAQATARNVAGHHAGRDQWLFHAP
jgi:ABC-2 type transport system permease protein